MADKIVKVWIKLLPTGGYQLTTGVLFPDKTIFREATDIAAPHELKPELKAAIAKSQKVHDMVTDAKRGDE